MRKAIGFIIVLWGITYYFGEATLSFEQAVVAGFGTFEAAAIVSQERLSEI